MSKEESNPFEEAFAEMEKRQKYESSMRDAQLSAAMGTTTDVSNELASIIKLIEKDPGLQLGALSAVMRTFNAVSDTLSESLGERHEDINKALGVVDPSDGESPSMIMLHSLQLLAAFVALKSMLFNRFRKVNTTADIVDECLGRGSIPSPEGLTALVSSTRDMLAFFSESGFQLNKAAADRMHLTKGMSRIMLQLEEIVEEQKE